MTFGSNFKLLIIRLLGATNGNQGQRVVQSSKTVQELAVFIHDLNNMKSFKEERLLTTIMCITPKNGSNINFLIMNWLLGAICKTRIRPQNMPQTYLSSLDMMRKDLFT